MPAYNFKAQFAPAVASGRKACTIRPKRKYPTKPGQHLKLYTGMRTKNCWLLNEGSCVSVEDVSIQVSSRAPGFCFYRVFVGGRELSGEEIDTLAKSDGFANSNEFVEFFGETYKLEVGQDLEGMELIRWQPRVVEGEHAAVLQESPVANTLEESPA